MKWPKRFRLHEAAATSASDTYQTDVIQARGDKLIAVDGVGLAQVPVLLPEERSGADLPRLERGETMPEGVVPPKAVQEAAQGSSGAGRLVLVSQSAVEAQRGEGKPWMRFERPAPGDMPPVDEVFEKTAQEAPDGGRWMEVSLDPEALVRLARAIGATEGVRLRFLVDEDGRLSGQGELHALIDVRPVDEPQGGGRAVLAAIVTSPRT